MKTEFLYNNNKYVIYPVFDGEHIFRRIERSSTFYEIGLLETVRKYKLTGTYLDIGANMGNHSIYFMNECRCTNLISIEPEPTIYKTLVKNINQNNHKNIPFKTYNCALGDRECTVSMDVNPKNSGATKVISESGDIDCHILDDLIFDDNIKVIKMDAEGYELKILHGAKRIISTHRPLIICEASTPEEFKQVNSYLEKFNYKTNKRKLAGTPTYAWEPRG